MAWGLEIESETLRLCRADLTRGRLHLHRRAEIAVPPGLIQPSQKDGNVADIPAFSELLRELCEKAGCRGWVRVALPDPVFSLRTLATDELPAKREEAQQFLRWQMRELLPFPAEEGRLDFLPLGSGQDGRARVVCLVAREGILGEYERALTGAGLQPALLDARSITLALAASEALQAETAGLLAVGKTWTTLLLLREGRPRFWRTLHEGTEAWTGAERLRLFREVADSLTFCHESEGLEPVEELALAGVGAWTTEVASSLTEWLEVPVAALDLCAALRTEGHPDDLVQWGVAIGAAIRPC
jgi:type IV pilus assembly protein PilM